LQSDLIVRVNYEKLDVTFRNRRLVELAEQCSSTVTAQVYETLLRLVEYRTPRCRDQAEIPREGEEGERYSAAIPLYNLAEEVDPHLDLVGSIGPTDPSQPSARRGKRPLEDGVNGDGEDEPDRAEKGPNRTHDVDQHLTLLAQPPRNFCSRRLTSGIPGWTVEYRHLARQLRHLEIERVVGARYGSVALRLLRILAAKGKLDEKRLQEISLMSSKDLRQVLGGMQSTGFVDLQEVPRDAQRQPSRTIYLWFYDPDRVSRNLLQDTYKAMSRCLQRLRFERNRLKEFLDKTERSDVKGNEERYLSETELRTLQQWRDKEALLLGEVSRLDDLVAVLRDF
jgi:DNA-directed RNA polymerase III subunit RPC3